MGSVLDLINARLPSWPWSNRCPHSPPDLGVFCAVTLLGASIHPLSPSHHNPRILKKNSPGHLQGKSPQLRFIFMVNTHVHHWGHARWSNKALSTQLGFGDDALEWEAPGPEPRLPPECPAPAPLSLSSLPASPPPPTSGMAGLAGWLECTS